MPRGGKQPGAGRPKGTVSDATRYAIAIREYFAKRAAEDMVIIYESLKKKYQKGDVSAVKEVLDRAIGRSGLSVEAPNGDGTLTVTWKS